MTRPDVVSGTHSLLANCVGDFGPAVAAGRSTIIGIEQAGALAFAVELHPAGVIHQFAGHANRPPDTTLRDATVHALLATGLIDPGDHRNLPWLPVPDRPGSGPSIGSNRRT